MCNLLFSKVELLPLAYYNLYRSMFISLFIRHVSAAETLNFLLIYAFPSCTLEQFLCRKRIDKAGQNFDSLLSVINFMRKLVLTHSESKLKSVKAVRDTWCFNIRFTSTLRSSSLFLTETKCAPGQHQHLLSRKLFALFALHSQSFHFVMATVFVPHQSSNSVCMNSCIALLLR